MATECHCYFYHIYEMLFFTQIQKVPITISKKNQFKSIFSLDWSLNDLEFSLNNYNLLIFHIHKLTLNTPQNPDVSVAILFLTIPRSFLYYMLNFYCCKVSKPYNIIFLIYYNRLYLSNQPFLKFKVIIFSFLTTILNDFIGLP